MKTKYYFVGTECHLGELKLEKFGTEVELTEAEAFNALDGGAALCPQTAWNFTPQEVKDFPFPAFRETAPDEFKAKLKAALIAIAAHLDDLRKATNV